MKRVVILLFWFTYLHITDGDESEANSNKMLQIDGLKTENILLSTEQGIIYQFTNNEKLNATCRRKKAGQIGDRITLSWYKSGSRLNTTTEDKLEQTFILKEIDAGTSLECRVRVEDSGNEDNGYQEGIMITLKYNNNTSPMKEYVLSSVQPETEAPPVLGITNNKVLMYGFIASIVIILTILLILITRKINKKIKRSKDNNLMSPAKPTKNVRYSSLKDACYGSPSFQQANVYSFPYSEAAKIYSESTPHVKAHQTFDPTVSGKLINNHYVQYKKNNLNLYENVHQNVPLTKDVVNDYDNVQTNVYSI